MLEIGQHLQEDMPVYAFPHFWKPVVAWKSKSH